jgi:hypothetical protein
MAQRVVLHAGLMKSGTSYLQKRLTANRDLLASRGVLFPGRVWRDQVLAVSDVLGRKHFGRLSDGTWASLVDEMAAFDGTALVSMEFLGPAPPERIAAVLDSLAGTPVEVVLTLRDLGRGVPAMWQESLQNGGSVPWGEYVDLLPGKQKPARAFWRQQGMARIVGNWVDAVGADRVTLVTVPPAGADPRLLWERFCSATGIPGEGYVDIPPANTSLDAASALVLRDLNARLADDDLPPRVYHKLVKFRLGKKVLGGRPGGPAIGFEPPRWLERRAAEIVARLAGSGARVVGDLADLTPVAVPGVDPRQVPEAERLAAAVDALRGLTLQRARKARRSVDDDV